MTERPIIFSAPEVRAILAGRKTMTRRIIKPQPPEWTANVIDISKPCFDDEMEGWGQVEIIWSRPSPDMPFGEPQREEWRPLKGLPWRPGDRAWVRETWKTHSTFRNVPPRAMPRSIIFYAADERYAPSGAPWRPSIHMPRWASRITLEITDVRVQRLQDISEADAVAEGCPGEYGAVEGMVVIVRSPIEAFRDLWTSIHGPGAWDANPWVVALTFRRVEGQGGADA